jgi:predicted metal-dependent enzyme (double-stranded beta helix superfamily)
MCAVATVFDLDRFIADCLDAAPDRAAVRAVVERAVSDPLAVEAVLTRKLRMADLGILHYSETLTIEHVVFPAAHRTGIHDHGVWAVIGTWRGYEDNHLYRREEAGISEPEITRCEPGQVITLSTDTIHEVHAPPTMASVALHVYGGPLFDQPRHSWNGQPPIEEPIDDAAYLDRYLAELRADGSLIESN